MNIKIVTKTTPIKVKTQWITSDEEEFDNEFEAIAWQEFIDANDRIAELPEYNGYVLLRNEADLADWWFTISDTIKDKIETHNVKAPIWIQLTFRNSIVEIKTVELDAIDEVFIKNFMGRIK